MSQVLDLCCGTGDMTFALYRRAGQWGGFTGADFAHPMLVRAREKSAGRDIRWVEADALQLPFAPGEFDLVTAAFGFRNLANYNRGLAEIYRVLAPKAKLAFWTLASPKD